PETSWMLQTTTAVTMIDGGTKPNVVASSASIVVNFRTMPGETLESVIKHVSGAIRDPRVAIRPVGNHREAATPSRTDSPAYGMLARTITEIAPEASVTVVPYLVPGGTDARYFTDLSE